MMNVDIDHEVGEDGDDDDDDDDRRFTGEDGSYRSGLSAADS